MTGVRAARGVLVGIGLPLLAFSWAVIGAQATWETRAPDPHAKMSPSIAEIGGRLYVQGFDQNAAGSPSAPRLSIYDPAANSWSTGASPALVRAFASAAGINGKLYVVGGCLMANCSAQTLTNKLEIYDPAANTWAEGAVMPTARFGAAAGVIGGKLYVTAGTTGNFVPTSVTEIYDPATNTWSTGAAIPASRELAASAVVDGRLYVIAGFQRDSVQHFNGAEVATVSVYDPVANTWSTGASMLEARSGAAAGVIDGKIYVTGGSKTGPVILATTEAYDPVGDIWAPEAPMPTPRYYVAGGVVGSWFYVIDGTNGTSLSANEAFTPFDVTPPSTTATPSAPANSFGWNNSNVTVTLAATDNPGGSGVQSITYLLSGAQTSGATVPGASVPVVINTEGTTTISYHATDVAGNDETAQSITIRLDKTVPFLGVPNGISTNAMSSAGAVVNFILNASDGLSGLDGDASSQPKSSGETFPVGTTVETVTAHDRAGNVATATFNVTVLPSRPIITVNGGTFVADGNPHPATASARDFFGAPIAGTLTLTYRPGGLSAPVGVGRYSATAEFTTGDPAFTSAQPWTTKPADPNPKASPSVVEMGGRLYVLGFDQDAAGNQSSFVPRLSIFDPGTGAWSTGASPAVVRAYANAAAINGKLYVVGGCVLSNCQSPTNQLEIYDPATNAWSSGPSMPIARFGAAAGVIGGKLYVAGGTTSCPICVPTNTTEIYDPAANTWTTGAPMPVSSELPASAVVNGLLYVIGGFERNAANTLVGNPVGTVSVYNPSANTWSSRSSMPTPRSGAAAGVVNGTIYVVGGSNSPAALATNEAYDPFSDSWTAEAPMLTGRYYVSGAVAGGTFYVIDGTNAGPRAANEAFDASMTAHVTINPPPNNPPFFVSPTPFAPVSVQATKPITFTVRASDSNASDVVTIDVDGSTLPSGASSTTTGPANPADRTFNWTPGAADVGQHDIVFNATDNHGSSAPTLTVRVNVTPPPVTLQSITVTPSSATLNVGQNQSFQAVGHFSDGSTQMLPGGSPGGLPIWQVHSSTGIDFAPCSTQQYPIGPGGFFAQGFTDHNGSVHETWSPMTPVVNVDGTINASDVALTLACTNGAATGSISAHWTGTRYDGTFTFNGGVSTGQVSITGWSSQAAMPASRFKHASASVGGSIYVIGGSNGAAVLSTVDAYNTANNTWTSGLSPMPTPRSSPGVAALNGIIYAAGGQLAGGAPTAIVEAYDPVQNSWTTLPAMATARSSVALVAAGSRLYAIGGTGNGGPVATVESYDPTTQTWSMLASMPAPGSPIAGVLGQTIVVVRSGSASTDIYDISTNTWHTGLPMPAPRSDMTGAVGNGGLFIAGGSVLGTPFYQTWVYYPAAGNRPQGWALVGSMPTARSSAAAAVVNDVVYVSGGTTTGNPSGVTAMEALSTPPFGDLTPQGGSSTPSVFWQSTNTSVASIDSSGFAHANRTGQTTIVAVAGNISCQPAGCASVTVSDTTPPSLSVPGNMTVQAMNSSGASVMFTATASDGVDGPRPVTCTPPSGSTFGFGTTTVNCSASDLSGNTAQRSFTITVQDTNPPSLNVPSQPWEATASSAAGAIVNYFVSATDTVDGNITPSCSPAKGSLFAIGSTTVSCQATDAHGNSSPTRAFVVKVYDKLTLVLPSNITAEATSASGAPVAFSVTATYFLGGSEPVQCFLITGFNGGNPIIGPEVSSGSIFALGTSTVGCVATHSQTGHSESGFFTITVRDTTPPAITTSGNVTLAATLPTGAVATFTASATDLVDGVVPVICVPSSGALFAVGTTTVTCTATDAHLNTRTATLSVTVLSPEEVTTLLIAQVVNLGFEQSRSLLENVLKSLDKDNTGAACNQLAAFINSVEAARGKSLSVAEADQLIQSATAARGALACR